MHHFNRQTVHWQADAGEVAGDIAAGFKHRLKGASQIARKPVKTSKEMRLAKAKQLLKVLARGGLSEDARAGILRDYAKDFAKLGVNP